MPQDRFVTRPVCPRCGYALRGVIESWHDRCPVDGTCTECGLDFHWRDVLVRARMLPTWCVEFGPARSIDRRVVKTIAMMLVPPIFWRRLWMTHPLRGRRIALLLVLQILLAVGVIWTSHGIRTWVYARDTGRSGPETTALVAQALLTPWSDEELIPVASGRWIPNTRWPPPATNSPPMRRGPGLSPRWWQPMYPSSLATLRMDVDAVTHSTPGSVSLLADTRQAASPIVLATVLTLAVLLTPVSFLALPWSRRLAKVRWAHVFRIWGYSLSLILFVWTVLTIVVFSRYLLPAGLPWAFVLIVPALLLIGWWASAARWYLRMDQPWIVGCVVVGLGAFAACATIAVAAMITL